MYLGDLKKEAESFSYFGDTTLVIVVEARPALRAFQVPLTGDPTPPSPLSFLYSPTLAP